MFMGVTGKASEQGLWQGYSGVAYLYFVKATEV